MSAPDPAPGGGAGAGPRWGGLLAHVVLFIGLYAAYKAARYILVPESGVQPRENAREIVALQENLGLFVEPSLQAWVSATSLVENLTSWFYSYSHPALAIVALLWLWFWRPVQFPFVWRWFWISHAVALFGFWLYPLAPPRLLPELGMQDPTNPQVEGGVGSWFEPFRNEFAAMPSLHVGYTFLFLVALWFLVPRPWRLLLLAWPVAMTHAVMATANHYWLDAVGGGITVGVGLIVTTLAFRDLPRPWDRTEPGQELRTAPAAPRRA